MPLKGSSFLTESPMSVSGMLPLQGSSTVQWGDVQVGRGGLTHSIPAILSVSFKRRCMHATGWMAYTIPFVRVSDHGRLQVKRGDPALSAAVNWKRPTTARPSDSSPESIAVRSRFLWD